MSYQPHKKHNKPSKYIKRVATFHQCSGCLTLVKGQLGISRHRKKCIFPATTFNKITDTTRNPLQLNDIQYEKYHQLRT